MKTCKVTLKVTFLIFYNINNRSSHMDEDKKQIIKESNYTYIDTLKICFLLNF